MESIDNIYLSCMAKKQPKQLGPFTVSKKYGLNSRYDFFYEIRISDKDAKSISMDMYAPSDDHRKNVIGMIGVKKRKCDVYVRISPLVFTTKLVGSVPKKTDVNAVVDVVISEFINVVNDEWI